MLEQTKRILFRISSVICKVEPDLHTGSDQKVPAPQHWLWAVFRIRIQGLSGSARSLKKILSVISTKNNFTLYKITGRYIFQLAWIRIEIFGWTWIQIQLNTDPKNRLWIQMHWIWIRIQGYAINKFLFFSLYGILKKK